MLETDDDGHYNLCCDIIATDGHIFDSFYHPADDRR
jgi:hypothetical protein